MFERYETRRQVRGGRTRFRLAFCLRRLDLHDWKHSVRWPAIASGLLRINFATTLHRKESNCLITTLPYKATGEMYKAVLVLASAHALQAPQLNRAPRAAAVAAVAPAPVWVAGSILGGAAGTPFVVKATNSWYSDPTVL